MPSPTIAQIRAALGATLGNLGLTVYQSPEDAVEGPCVVIILDPKLSVEYGKSFHMGSPTYHFLLTLMVPKTDNDTAYADLDSYVDQHGANSIAECLFNNPSLGIDDCDATAENVFNYGSDKMVAGFEYLGAFMRVSVICL